MRAAYGGSNSVGLKSLPDSDDRRLVRHYLTPEGAQSLEEMARTARAYLTEILRQLPREKLERLLEALQDLSQAAEAVEKRTLASAGQESRP